MSQFHMIKLTSVMVEDQAKARAPERAEVAGPLLDAALAMLLATES